ncbi:glycogen debranching N-terminal domain-containing protein [Planotetraspora phitsanulokensis]|uniref:Amylo-alpha-1,6-glucosidase n=1 Tax=Planotetraspora phitsanulokensis TaxID=575192 RepID=A0A8J3UJM9_9ACTN|nr:glycogen debranching N-terminal domain-containing protein [Planotetraspora phitsanulokensis]GII43499.1 amylo-alpha-1,6-glucosidase [Planotetraspora phitsanulokensis]
MDGWTFEGQPKTLESTMTLVAGGSFCVSARNGDILPGGTQGVFYADTRLLSQWELHIDDAPVEELQVLAAEPYHATFIGRATRRPGQSESTLLVIRDRYTGGGLCEDIVLRNLSDEPAGCVASLNVHSEVCDLFEVKTDRVRRVADVEATAEARALRLFSVSRARGVRVVAGGDDIPVLVVPPGLLIFRVVVPARGEVRICLQANPIIDGVESEPWFSATCPPQHAEAARWLSEWEVETGAVTTSNTTLAGILDRSRTDLGSLRLFESEHPDEPPSIAAGAPWFMTLFGRDSLLASWLALPLDQNLALGTLRRLARLQGVKVDPLTEEEPGKIMHELRYGVRTVASESGVRAYYGSVDATPLFVVLLGELRRWGLHRGAVDEFMPHADAALDWIERYGMRDGFLWYRRKTDQGLVNQGWKDSFDGINFADGSLARPPIALAEVQGYVYAAYLARHYFAREAGDTETERRYAAKAAELRQAFNEKFWLPDRGYYAMGLDRDGRPIDGLGSNMGHCLWSGIVDRDKAGSVAEHLLSPQMFTGFGVRTLASDMGAYNPMSYHNGSVWPHDNALIAAGLMRYGFIDDALFIVTGLLDAARAFNGRLPELFCGFDRQEFPVPVPYPTSCSPQAWASATPIQLVRILLRMDPWVPIGKLWIAPVLPEGFGSLKISHLPLAGTRITVEVGDGSEEVPVVTGLPEEISLIAGPRPASAASLHAARQSG